MKSHKRDDMQWLPKFLIAKFAIWGAIVVIAINLYSCMPAGSSIYSSSTMAAPTVAGNGSVQSTNVAGLYSNTTGTSPDGRAMVDRCIEIQRDWNEYLTQSGLTPSQNNWMMWYRMQQLSSVPDRCIDYATFGQLMSAGTNGFGVSGYGSFNGRRFKKVCSR